MRLSLKTKVGEWKKTREWLKKLSEDDYLKILNSCGERGVRALASATPVDTGRTAASWSYEIERSDGHTTISWHNDNLTSQGDPVAILLQYGHGTGTGGYVQGRDYINPAIQPVFDDISEEVWKAVQSL